MAYAVDIDSLNPAQREAVLTTEGPLLVLAGAGSGKTRVLTFRIAHMVADLGVRPWQLLAITFTVASASDLSGRRESRDCRRYRREDRERVLREERSPALPLTYMGFSCSIGYHLAMP